MNYKFCWSTKITDPKILSHPKIACNSTDSVPFISQIHEERENEIVSTKARGKVGEQGRKWKGIGPTARKREIKETRERKKTESSLSQNQKPKAEEWEYLLSPYTAQDSQKSQFSLLSWSPKHQITLRTGCCSSVMRTSELVWRQKRKHFYGAFLHTAFFSVFPLPFTPSALHIVVCVLCHKFSYTCHVSLTAGK